MSYADRLAPYDDAFKEANRMRDFDELPDPGDYQGVIDRFDLFEGKRNGRLYLKTEIKLLEPAGWPVSTLHDLEDPERFEFLKTHLHRLGLDTENFQLSKVEELVAQALDVPVEVNVYEYESKKVPGKVERGVRVNKTLGGPMRQMPVSDVPADTTGMGDPGPEQPPAAGKDEFGF